VLDENLLVPSIVRRRCSKHVLPISVVVFPPIEMTEDERVTTIYSYEIKRCSAVNVFVTHLSRRRVPKSGLEFLGGSTASDSAERKN